MHGSNYVAAELISLLDELVEEDGLDVKSKHMAAYYSGRLKQAKAAEAKQPRTKTKWSLNRAKGYPVSKSTRR